MSKRRLTYTVNKTKAIGIMIMWIFFQCLGVIIFFNGYLEYMGGFLITSICLLLFDIVPRETILREVWNGKEWIVVNKFYEKVEK